MLGIPPLARVVVRRVVVLLLLLATLVALAIQWVTRPQHDEAATPSTRVTACVDAPPLKDVATLNRFVARVRSTASFAGGDVGASVRLQDGRGLFVFGDTLRGDEPSGRSFVRNSMLVFSPGCGRVVLPAGGGAVIPNRADGVGYWPMSIAKVRRDGYDLVGVSAQRVRTLPGNNIFSFEVLGPAAALFKVPVGGAPQLLKVVDLGADTADTTAPMWGAAAVVDDGWVYLYGTSRPANATLGGFDLRVARVRPMRLLHQASWRFWDGRAWSRDAAAAAVLVPNRGGVSQTLSVFRRGQVWYAVSKRDEVLGTDLTIWRSPSAHGPFVAAPALAKIPSDAVTGTLRYMPLAHPDLLPEPGSVVVSYSVNNTDFQLVKDDPRRYRPRFLRVPLP